VIVVDGGAAAGITPSQAREF